jgi:hypothetical protein
MRYLTTLLFILLSTLSFSQDSTIQKAEVKKSSIEFNGGKYNGYEIELNAPADIVEDAIKQKFKSMGTKPKEIKGFMVYRNVLLTSIDPLKPVDAFIKVDRKSKKEKDQTLIYFIASGTGEIGDEKLKADASGKAGVASLENGDAFLLGMLPAVKMGVFDKDLANQQTIVKKEEKNLVNLKEDQADLEKKIKKLQSDLEYNIKAQERQTIEVEKVKSKLNELIAKKPLN